MNATQFAPIEREVIVLDAVGSSIDTMVHRGHFQFLGPTDETEIRFHSQPHEQLFTVLLADLLENVSSQLVGEKATPTALLVSVCSTPHFNADGSIAALKQPVDVWASWLSAEIQVPVWLPSFDRTVTLSIARGELLRILGTISKHGFGRLTRIASTLSALLTKLGEGIPPLEALRGLDEFYDKFRGDVLGHQTMPLAEMLNDLRWGIQGYLEPEFARSYAPVAGSLAYDYRVPPAIVAPLAKASYWNVMNDIRRRPLVEPFRYRRLKTLSPKY